MKNLGKILSKKEQKSIQGSGGRCIPQMSGSCRFNSDCCQDNPGGQVWCINNICIPD